MEAEHNFALAKIAIAEDEISKLRERNQAVYEEKYIIESERNTVEAELAELVKAASKNKDTMNGHKEELRRIVAIYESNLRGTGTGKDFDALKLGGNDLDDESDLEQMIGQTEQLRKQHHEMLADIKAGFRAHSNPLQLKLARMKYDCLLAEMQAERELEGGTLPVAASKDGLKAAIADLENQSLQQVCGGCGAVCFDSRIFAAEVLTLFALHDGTFRRERNCRVRNWQTKPGNGKLSMNLRNSKESMALRRKAAKS
jgi:hypothetical protein